MPSFAALTNEEINYQRLGSLSRSGTSYSLPLLPQCTVILNLFQDLLILTKRMLK